MSALAFYAKAWGCPDPTSDFCIQKMIEGWGKEKSRLQDKRTPVLPNILLKLAEVWDKVCNNSYEVALFRAATLLAFWGRV